MAAPQIFPARLKQQLEQSTQEFFAANNIQSLTPMPDSGDAEFQWTGIIGLAGDQLTGSLSISCTQELLDKTHPNHALGMPVGPDDFVDWLGEIANQLLGRLKNFTLEYSVAFSLSAPSVVKGECLEVLDQGKKAIQKLYFKADGLPIMVTLIAAIPPTLNYDEAEKVSKKGHIAEGDGFLF